MPFEKEKKEVNLKVSSNVTGTEGLDINLDYKNTSLKTVVLVQYAQVCAFKKIIEQQAAQLGVDLKGLE